MLENGAFNVSSTDMCFWKISMSKRDHSFCGHLQLVKVFFGMFVIDVCHLHPNSPLNIGLCPKSKGKKSSKFIKFQVRKCEFQGV